MRLNAILLLIVTFAFVSSSLGYAAEDYAYLHRDNFINLSVKAPQKAFAITAPGRASGICGVEIRFSETHGDLDRLKRAIVVQEGFSLPEQGIELRDITAPGSNILRFRLVTYETSRYVTKVQISTRSGEPLAEVINALLGRKNTPRVLAIVTAGACPRKAAEN